MGQGIFINMRVCPGPSLPEAGVGTTEWQAPERKTYDSGQSGGIKHGKKGSL